MDELVVEEFAGSLEVTVFDGGWSTVPISTNRFVGRIRSTLEPTGRRVGNEGRYPAPAFRTGGLTNEPRSNRIAIGCGVAAQYRSIVFGVK